MQAAIMINVAGGVATARTVRVSVDGAGLALALNEGVAAGVGGAFTNIAILAGAVSFATAPGGAFGGTLTLMLDLSGQVPAVTLDGLGHASGGNPATLTWPTANGEETQILSPGVPLVLSGVAGS